MAFGSKQSILNGIGAVASMLAVLMTDGEQALAQEKLTYNMAWLPQGSTAAVPIALQQGWFKEEGLDVTVVRGYGGNRTANELDQGQFEIGYVDPVSLILNRSKGGKIRMIGAINTIWPAGICFVPNKHNVKTIDDLKGLTLGGGSASPVHNVVPVWLEMNGKPRDFIKLVRLDPAVVDASFVEGRTNLAECWRASNRAVIAKQAKNAGIGIGVLEYSDFGLNAYGSGFAAREELIQSKPEALRKFLRVAYRGYEFMRQAPEQAADIMQKVYPTIDREVFLNQIKDINELYLDPQSPSKTVGFLREDRLADTLSLIDKAYQLNGAVKLGDIYTNELLN